MRSIVLVFFCAVALNLGAHNSAQAQETVAILMPGAAGVAPGDFLMRNRARIEGAGIRTIVTTSFSEAASLSQAETAKGSKVVLVGMSRGALHVASALASGARVRGAVFVSGNYDAVKSLLGSPAALPQSLVVHHRRDACKFTRPGAAPGFAAWSAGKASLRWIDTQGTPVPNECGPRGAHGFFQQDGPAISAIVGFIRSR